MTVHLVAFLRARLDEDEQTARAAQPAPWVRHDHVAGVHANDATDERPYGSAVADCRRVPGGYGVTNAEHIVRHQPARVLADVAARRAVLDLYEEPEASDALPDSVNRFTSSIQRHVIGEVLPHLALPYADHPDYREEWRP
ncbi:DUF6221 family protein [Streptomyces sp. ISL-11]|uniref:DUF6221 family protein n=1 Tax=Streptomyces sp. ISL-11 TaxID=2819174 RepID=UPI001BEA0247|nr:DUF6221 family protein [Streptomyces sp. ISL-11]MBT2385616.1 hypothetical protein [Streptomyces sp. ISL-11]